MRLITLAACAATFVAAVAVPAVAQTTRPASTQPATTRPATTAPATRPAGATVVETEAVPAEYDRDAGLGTRGYGPTDAEAPFLKALPVEERATGSILDSKSAYDMNARRGKPVSWFGIVRKVDRQADGSYELLLEQKYFDGLTDLHILALSFNGGGDFKARVVTKDPPAEPLMLVRVYGKVAADKADPPTIAAEYVRVFPWRTFTFLAAYGKDASNPEWRKLCKAPLDRIYVPYPNDLYYTNRLGERPKRL